MDPSTFLLGNAAGADPSTTESAGGGRPNLTASTDGDRTSNNNNRRLGVLGPGHLGHEGLFWAVFGVRWLMRGQGSLGVAYV